MLGQIPKPDCTDTLSRVSSAKDNTLRKEYLEDMK